MSVSDISSIKPADIISRVKGILLSPLTEWDRIEAEPSTVGGIFAGYVIVLAAITPIAQLIGSQVFGYGAFGFSYRPPLIASLATAVISYVVGLVMVYVFAFVINALAPNFGGQKNQTLAFKVAAYSATAAWISGIFGLIPMLGILGIFGLYSLYLLYLGLPRLMKAPQAQALTYTVVVVVVMIVVGLVIGVVTFAIEAPFRLAGALSHPTGISSTMFGAPAAGSVTINTPGGGTVNVNQLGAAASQAAAQINASQTGAPGAIKAVAPDALKAMLPDSLAGLDRTEIEAAGGGVAGMNAASAKASYAKGDAHIDLSIVDLGAMGAMAGMAGVANVQGDKETATGYEKTGQVNGRFTTEEFDHQSKQGKFGVLVASRFMVEADGENVSIDDLKAAVSGVGLDRLEGMSRPG